MLGEFLERNGLPGVPFGEDGVARLPLPDMGDLSVDVSCQDRPCLHVLMFADHPPVAFLLKGLWLCDPTRLVGSPMHFVGDGEGRRGFLIALDRDRLSADSLSTALAQIVGALARLQQR